MTTRILTGHNIDVLATLPAASVHLAICSPPYWSLRAYNTVPQVWANPDGTPLCGAHPWQARGEHEWDEAGPVRVQPSVSASTTLTGGTPADQEARGGGLRAGATCAHCGAWRGELGSEPTVELYLAHLVAVFRAVRRVLRKDGTCWVNLAGSYFNDPGGQNGGSRNGQGSNTISEGRQQPKLAELHRISAKAVEANKQAGRQDRTGAVPRDYWLKPLDFVDVPGLFARAMQEAGWWWRADIALVKRSPLPESVSGTRWERCRVKVRSLRTETKRGAAVGHRDNPGGASGGFAGAPAAEWQDCPGCRRCEPNDGLVLRRGNGRPTRSWEHLLVFAAGPGYFWDSESVREDSPASSRSDGLPPEVMRLQTAATTGRTDGFTRPPNYAGRSGGRNLRDWQWWPNNALKDAHYASYSPDLAALAIKAGTSGAGCCPVCGAPWARVVERGGLDGRGAYPGKPFHLEPQGYLREGGSRAGDVEYSRTLAWRPTCSPKCPGHSQAPRPAVVLDPFCGAGSTMLAAESLGRDSIGIDLQPTYAAIAVKRGSANGYTEVTTENNGATTLRQRDLLSLLGDLMAEQEESDV